MKKYLLLVIGAMTLIFAGCEPNGPTDAGDESNGDTNATAKRIGVFSVSIDKQVTFSPGNLQYTQSTNTWSFAANQYDYIGTDNVTGGSVSSGQYSDGTALADKVDLFGWSTSATNFGVSTSTSSSDYSGSFVDWGTNKIGNDAPNTWRTLTYDEWDYLLNTRTNASALKGVAQVNGVNGLILLPDNWTCPAGVTFKSGFHSNEGANYYAAIKPLPLRSGQNLNMLVQSSSPLRVIATAPVCPACSSTVNIGLLQRAMATTRATYTSARTNQT